MTLTREDLVQAIANLNESTRTRAISWRVCDSPSPPIANTLAAIMLQGFSYCAPYEGKILRVTEYRSMNPSTTKTPDPEMSTQNYYTLEIADEKGKPLYRFPTVQGIADLFQSVRIQMADVDDVINSLLNRR